MPIATFPLGPLQTNSYLVHNGSTALAVDVGGDPAPMLQYLEEHGLTLQTIVLTHLHFDHMYGVKMLHLKTKANILVPSHDRCLLDTESGKGGIWGFPLVEAFDADDLPAGKQNLGGMECMVLQTPGHTPGGVSLYFPAEKAVLTGDALFHRSIGRTDFLGGNHEQLLASIRGQLFPLPDETVVYPGHGCVSTIGEERSSNPFCGEFAQ